MPGRPRKHKTLAALDLRYPREEAPVEKTPLYSVLEQVPRYFHSYFLRCFFRSLPFSAAILSFLSPLPIPSVQAETTTQTNIGVILPLTGDAARFGEIIGAGVRAGASPQVKLLFEDEACEAAAAVSAFRKLRNVNGIRLFVGPFCGSPQTAVAAISEKESSFVILGSAAPAAVTAASKGSAISVAPSLESEARFIAQELNKRFGKSKNKKVLIAHGGTDFGLAYEIAFTEVFTGQIVDSFTMNAVDASGLKSLVTRIQALKPDALFVPDAIPFLTGLPKELAASGLKKLPVYSIYAVQMPDILKILKLAPINLEYSYPNIGARDALSYFPQRAAELASQLAAVCRDEPTCLKSHAIQLLPVTPEGFVSVDFVLKRPS